LGWSARQAVLAETEAAGFVYRTITSVAARPSRQCMNDVEAALGEQMVVEARMAAHLVAMGEAAGLSTNEIKPATSSKLRTIRAGRNLHYRRERVMLIWEISPTWTSHLVQTLSSSPKPCFFATTYRKDQSVVQKRAQRDIDTKFFNMWGCRGWTSRAIVQVVITPPSQQLRAAYGADRLVNQLVSEGIVLAIRVLDKSMNTVDHAERVRDDKLPEPTESELAEHPPSRQNRTREKFFGKIISEGRGSYLATKAAN